MTGMNVAARAAEYARWRTDGDLPGHVLYSVAYRVPAWDRTLPALGAYGWTSYQNAAAIRQLTTGESDKSWARICICCEMPKGYPHKPWCVVRTGTLNSLPAGSRAWTVEVVDLSHARQRRPRGNHPAPARSGEQFAVSHHGALRGYAATVEELGRLVPLAELAELAEVPG